MLKNHKKTLILTSLLTLLPIPVGLLLWKQFPEYMITHWGLDGQPDGWSSIPFAVFAPPLMILAVQWLCILFTSKDPGNKGRNHKIQALVLWIIPLISNFSSYMMYALALDIEISVDTVMMAIFGLLFAAIGNYLPKTRTNSTIGIRVPWTFSSEENWNATHRTAGKLWLAGGILMALSAFLPGGLGMTIWFLTMIALVVVPIAYSYRFYKQEKASGKAVAAAYSAADKKITKVSIIFLAVFTVFILYVLFAGSIDYQFREDSLLIDTNMYTDHVVYYDDIESVEYRDGNVDGSRIGGFGSLHLLMGYFKNEEFGTHIRYTYYNPEACVVLDVGGKALVLSGETKEETRAIYQELLQKIKQ